MPDPTPATTTTAAPATTTHWPQVKAILDDLIAGWTGANGFPPDLTGAGTHNDPGFGWATKDQLAGSKPRGFQLIAPGTPGKDTNLVKALRDAGGVGGFGRMPKDGPYLTDAGKLDYIIRWIDEGMPD